VNNLAMSLPSLRVTMAGFALERDGFPAVFTAMSSRRRVAVEPSSITA